MRPANDCVLDFFSSLVFYDDTGTVYGFSSHTIVCNVRKLVRSTAHALCIKCDLYLVIRCREKSGGAMYMLDLYVVGIYMYINQ